jgi:hypothetical protein
MEDKEFQENIKTTIEGLIYSLISDRPRNVVKFRLIKL